MEHNKKISRAGTVSRPASLRREYGIEPGEKVNISVNAKGVIEVTRIEGACVFCRNNDDLVNYAGRYICAACLQEVRRLGADE